MKDVSLKALNKKLVFPIPKIMYDYLRGSTHGEKKIRDMVQLNSEDALTWNFFRTLYHLANYEKSLSIPVIFPAGSSLKINFGHTDFYVWNRLTNGRMDNLTQRLNCVLERSEANPKSFSEIDAIIWDRNERRHKLYFFENKFQSDFSKCSAIEKYNECRLIRTNKKPEDNGCSYWGKGEGGDDYKRRFTRNLVEEYFQDTFSSPQNLTDTQADCYLYYQLMRNVIIGQELARDIGADFTLVSIISEKYKFDYNKNIWETFVEKVKNIQTQLLTWEGLFLTLEKEPNLKMIKYTKWLENRLNDNLTS